jgi:hypothetical protein
MLWSYPSREDDPWYDAFKDFVLAVDGSGFAHREDRSIVWSGGGTISWDLTSETLTWSGVIEVFSPLSGKLMQVAAGQVNNWANGEVVYLDVTRQLLVNTTKTFSKATSLPSTDDAMAFAVRIGDVIYFRTGISLGDGDSSTGIAPVPGGSGTDPDAIHDNVAGEINAVTTKGTPVSGDLLLIEDSADSNNKKKITIGTLPTGSDADAIHDNVAGEISAIAAKATPTTSDYLIIEDAADSDNKKSITIGDIPSLGTDSDAIHDNVAAEISAVSLKATPVSGDLLLIEDSADSNNKKRVTIGTLPTGSDADAIHDNVASEISAIAAKATPTTSDYLLIEDAADSNNKKSITIGDLPSGGGSPFEVDSGNNEIQPVTADIGRTFIVGSQTTEDSGASNDSRMFFHKSTGSFRAGIVEGAEWDSGNRGAASFASGKKTTASGDYSHAEGYSNRASGYASHCEGAFNYADEHTAHCEGYDSGAYGMASHAEGLSSEAYGYADHAEGSQCWSQPYSTASWYGGNHAGGRNSVSRGRTGSFSHGNQANTYGYSTFACGEGTISGGTGGHAEGRNTYAGGYSTLSSVDGPHAEGFNTYAYETGSHAEGYRTKAHTVAAHAEGFKSEATGGTYPHAEGYGTLASGDKGAHSEGYYTTASGDSSHSEGYYTTASGDSSHAEGSDTESSGNFSHAQGVDTEAEGMASFAHGSESIARLHFSEATAGNSFNSFGDGQNIRINAGTTTTNDTPKELSLAYDQATSDISILDGSSWGFYARVQGRENTEDGDCYFAIFEGLIQRSGNTVSLVPSSPLVPRNTFSTAGAAAWSAAIKDDAAGKFNIEVTGAAGTTIYWVAEIQATEICIPPIV